MKDIIIILLLSSYTYAQEKISVKKEGNSIILVNRPKSYDIKEDTVSYLMKSKNKYIDYNFRRTRLNNDKCNILLHSKLFPAFDSLKIITDNKKKSILIYENIKKNNTPSPQFKGRVISYKIHPIEQHINGYYYVDVFKTTYRNNYKRYITSMSRFFVIDGIEHEISVYTQGPPYNKTACRSRKVVFHEFKELVNNFTIE